MNEKMYAEFARAPLIIPERVLFHQSINYISVKSPRFLL